VPALSLAYGPLVLIRRSVSPCPNCAMAVLFVSVEGCEPPRPVGLC